MINHGGFSKLQDEGEHSSTFVNCNVKKIYKIPNVKFLSFSKLKIIGEECSKTAKSSISERFPKIQILTSRKTSEMLSVMASVLSPDVVVVAVVC